MKKKLIIITILGAILSIIIYAYTKKDEVNIVALGDGLALGMTPYNIKGYSFNDYLKVNFQEHHKLNKYYDYTSFGKTVKELIYEIKDNKALILNEEKIEIQRAINEASILTVAIGMDELSEDKITKNIIKDYQKDIEELLSLINNLNNNKVIVLGLYTIKDEEQLNIAKLNGIIEDITLKNGFIYLNISHILNNQNYYLDKNNYYINYLGHKKIYNLIKKVL